MTEEDEGEYAGKMEAVTVPDLETIRRWRAGRDSPVPLLTPSELECFMHLFAFMEGVCAALGPEWELARRAFSDEFTDVAGPLLAAVSEREGLV